MLGEIAFGAIAGGLAATGAGRWIGRAILLLAVIGIVGYKVVAAILCCLAALWAAAFVLGFALEALAEPARKPVVLE